MHGQVVTSRHVDKALFCCQQFHFPSKTNQTTPKAQYSPWFLSFYSVFLTSYQLKHIICGSLSSSFYFLFYFSLYHRKCLLLHIRDCCLWPHTECWGVFMQMVKLFQNLHLQFKHKMLHFVCLYYCIVTLFLPNQCYFEQANK